MTIIPETSAETGIFLQNHPEFANLLSEYSYDCILSRAPSHALVQLRQLLDITPLATACVTYHKQAGVGRPPIHTVPRLLRALVVKYFYNYSLRELEFNIRFNLLIKWFIGYPIFAEGPDHSTLCRFELYLILNHPRLFFDSILNQIDVAFPDDRTRPQIGDTFAMHANAALESLIKRLRHTCQQLLSAQEASAPESYPQLWLQLDEVTLFGAVDESTEGYLSSDQWRQRLHTTVAAALDCLRLIRQTHIAPSVQIWISRLEKILGDELRLEYNENGRLLDISLLSAKKRGSYRICSATDPDATIRNHGPGKKDFGYNISVVTTTDFIREIQADTGSRPDASPIPELLHTQRQQHAICPPKFIYDQAAGWGKTAHLVNQVTDGRTQLIAKPMPTKKRKGLFSPGDFALRDDGLALTCPNGRISRRKYRSGSGDGHNFRFIAAQCLGCPLLKHCRGKDDTPTTHKMVFISDYRAEWDALVAYSQTDDFKLAMKLRPQVERVIAGLVLHNGARRARFRGQQKVDFQAKMCAAAYNLKRWISLQSGKLYKKRRRFGMPRPSQPDLSLSMGGLGLVTA